MIVLGLAWAFIAARMPDREPMLVYPLLKEKQIVDETEKTAERNRRRKMRNKLKS
jgi:hypothetical protein